MGFEWRKILCQIGIAAKVMLAHSGVHISFKLTHQQFIAAQQIKESISAHFNVMLFKEYVEFNK